MIQKFINFLVGNAKPVHVDGALYVMIALFGAALTALTNDDVYKYMSPYLVFYLKMFCSLALAVVTALKMFRSSSYAAHEQVAKVERAKEVVKADKEEARAEVVKDAKAEALVTEIKTP